MKKKVISIVAIIVVIIAAISSGWIYNIVRTNKANELTTLLDTFRQQYGTEAVIKDLVSPKKVYAVSWSDNGYNNISWNIGGIWVTVFSTPVIEVPIEEVDE